MKFITLALILLFLANTAWGMYGEDTAPSEKDSQYMIDREDSEDITLPERETVMPEAMQDIREEQEDNPEEYYIEDNMKQRVGFDDEREID